MRLAVFCDYRFWRKADTFYTERAFIVFIGGLAAHCERLIMPGRVDPGEPSEMAHYPLPDGIELAPLPWYESLNRPGQVLRALLGSLRAFWRVLDDVDAVWLLGPHPLVPPFALLAWLRGRRVALGVRQDLPTLLKSKHPGRRTVALAADLLELTNRLLSRAASTVVVGPDLANGYRHARRLLTIVVSLIRSVDLPDRVARRDWQGGDLIALSVGRLEGEKNPLLLAEILVELRRLDGRWRLVICGEGPMRHELERRLQELGVDDRATLVGYLPIDGGLQALYRSSNALLHVSHTEGVPQVLFEAFAVGLPVVATDVGGVGLAVGDAALLVPPGQARPPAQALDQLARDPAMASDLAERGLERVRSHTLEVETQRLARFLEAK